MNPDTYLILAFLLGGLFVVYLLLKRQLSIPQTPTTDPTMVEWLKSIQSSLQNSNQNVTSTLQQSYRDLNERLDKAASVIGELKKEAGTFTEIGRSMRDLQDFLQSPKLRGNIGEQVLKDLINQVLPKSSFNFQYAFKTGSIVDAAIKTDAGILPIDSKFPSDNFKKLISAKDPAEKDEAEKAFARDVKKHIKDISTKYILPDEGTVDFAMMYLPSESVYYELINRQELMDYAKDLRVVPTSPTSLYVHLRNILLSLEGQKIESKSKQIFALLRSISKDYEKLDGNLSTLNRHIGNAYNQMNQVTQSFSQLGQKLDSTKNLDLKDTPKLED